MLRFYDDDYWWLYEPDTRSFALDYGDGSTSRWITAWPEEDEYSSGLPLDYAQWLPDN